MMAERKQQTLTRHRPRDGGNVGVEQRRVVCLGPQRRQFDIATDENQRVVAGAGAMDVARKAGLIGPCWRPGKDDEYGGANAVLDLFEFNEVVALAADAVIGKSDVGGNDIDQLKGRPYRRLNHEGMVAQVLA
jgi:hypothetical protein